MRAPLFLIVFLLVSMAATAFPVRTRSPPIKSPQPLQEAPSTLRLYLANIRSRVDFYNNKLQEENLEANGYCFSYEGLVTEAPRAGVHTGVEWELRSYSKMVPSGVSGMSGCLVEFESPIGSNFTLAAGKINGTIWLARSSGTVDQIIIEFAVIDWNSTGPNIEPTTTAGGRILFEDVHPDPAPALATADRPWEDWRYDFSFELTSDLEIPYPGAFRIDERTGRLIFYPVTLRLRIWLLTDSSFAVKFLVYSPDYPAYIDLPVRSLLKPRVSIENPDGERVTTFYTNIDPQIQEVRITTEIDNGVGLYDTNLWIRILDADGNVVEETYWTGSGDTPNATDGLARSYVTGDWSPLHTYFYRYESPVIASLTWYYGGMGAAPGVYTVEVVYHGLSGHEVTWREQIELVELGSDNLVSFTAAENRTGEPLAGARIIVHKLIRVENKTEVSPYPRVAITDENGVASMYLEDGNYSVTLLYQFENVTSTIIHVPEEKSVAFSPVLYTVRLVLIDRHGVVLPNASVTLFIPATGYAHLVNGTRYGEVGPVPVIPTDNLTIVVSWLATTVKVFSTPVTQDLDLTLSCDVYHLTVHVVDCNNVPIRNAEVRVILPIEQQGTVYNYTIFWGYTDGDGNFIVPLPANQPVEIRVAYEGYEKVFSPVSITYDQLLNVTFEEVDVTYVELPPYH
ncbi:hypothetical protein DRN94_001375, partial [archaeon]|nr:hypothetical protein [archaeon]